MKSACRRKNLQSGQGLVEYALILVLVAVVVIGILAVLGPQVGNVFCNVTNTIGSGPAVACTSANAGGNAANNCNNGNGNGNGNCNNGNGNGNNGNGNGNGG